MQLLTGHTVITPSIVEWSGNIIEKEIEREKLLKAKNLKSWKPYFASINLLNLLLGNKRSSYDQYLFWKVKFETIAEAVNEVT